MVERTLVVDHLKLEYDGVFNPDELYNVVASFFFEKGWDWYEKMNELQVTPAWKQIRMIFEPWKNISDYYKIAVKIKILISNVTPADLEKDQQKLNVSNGKINITFDGFVISDRDNQWSSKPLHWFMSIVFEKYFFRDHFAKAETWIRGDIEDVHRQVKTYLNSFHYSYSKQGS